MQLPHSKTLKQIIKDGSEKAGIDDEYLYGQHKAYVKYQKEREEEGDPRPLGVGVVVSRLPRLPRPSPRPRETQARSNYYALSAKNVVLN